jgi:competence protein ComEC
MAVVDADSTWQKPGKGAGLQAALWSIWSREQDRLVVWSPLFLVIGIWTYFNMATEPQSWVAWLLLASIIIAFIKLRNNRIVLLFTIVALGFTVAKFRTDWVQTPLLRAYTPAAEVSGYVADIEHRSRGSFVIVLDVTRATVPESEKPLRIRFTWRGKKLAPPKLGDKIDVVADLSPIPRPAAPGAFDYGRQLFFDSIGATGRVKSLLIQAGDMPLRYQLRATFHQLRSTVGERIRAAIPGPLGAVAEALITGERAAIPRSMNESLQSSGLFHILSISGLHMTLVAGGAFWASRAGLALSPRLALQYPIKKWAASFALLVGLLYMLLADGGAATERSFIMIAVFFFAVLVDRPAISLHNLAIAAVFILLWQPEQAISASFQMSFLAVMGLAAFYPVWTKAEQRVWPQRHAGLAMIWSRRLVLLFVASLLTSLIAGSLSGIAAAHHFGRVAPYGVIANALALPVTGLAVMPMAMLAVLLMPFGLEQLPLSIMERGLEVMMLISDWVASWNNAALKLPLLPKTTAVLGAFAAALLCLPSSLLRWLAVPLVAASVWSWQTAKPVVLVDERGGNVALLHDNGITPALPKQAPQSLSRWKNIYGDENSAQVVSPWLCEKAICKVTVNGLMLAFLTREHESRRACPSADVVIAAYPLRRRCKGAKITLDRFDVWRNGAYAIYADGTVTSARGSQGKRLWVYEPRARAKPFNGKSP